MGPIRLSYNRSCRRVGKFPSPGGRPLPCKPDSVHPGVSGVGRSFLFPRKAGLRRIGVRLIPGDSTGGRPFPCSVLHHAGFAVPPSSPPARWALTPPFHPYLCPCGPSAVRFLLHFPSGRLDATVPLFQGARCPVVSGLSSGDFRRSPQRSPGERQDRASALGKRIPSAKFAGVAIHP